MLVAWVMPSIDPVFGAACRQSMDRDIRERLLVVNNQQDNHGVAASWNMGIRFAVRHRSEWLVIVSESMRFGEHGGKDFEAGLEAAHTGFVGGACDGTCIEVIETGQGFCRRGYGWHLCALHRTTWEKVGFFDEIFYPAWWEDADYRLRMRRANILADETFVAGVDAHLAACEHTLTMGFLGSVGWWTTMHHYHLKWGGGPGEEKYVRPYNDPRLDYTHTGLQGARQQA